MGGARVWGFGKQTACLQQETRGQNWGFFGPGPITPPFAKHFFLELEA